MPLADELLGSAVASALIASFREADSTAELRSLSRGPDRITGLALRERSDVLRDAILDDFPGDYASLAQVIRAAQKTNRPLSGWMIWPVSSAVAERAVAENTSESFDDAMALLAELTPLLSAEFAIRTLLRHDLDRALAIIEGWTHSENEHARRLASEGTRLYLPWGTQVPQLNASPERTAAILNTLYRDESEYVRRSVANHLNDLSRKNDALVVAIATAWVDSPDDNTPALVRHALRTLIKRGHPEALALLGFHPVDLDVSALSLSASEIDFGADITFETTVTNIGSEPAKIAIDYLVHHMRANGKPTAKTFKLKSIELAPGESVPVAKSHSFRPITTRRYYPGEHAIQVQINGISYGRSYFALREPASSDTGTPA